MIYIEDVEPHFKHNTTHSLVREILFSLLSCYWLLELRRYTWKDYLWHAYGVFIIGSCYN
jgi:hypothetical protein